ncbi:cytochrome c oxidase subunit II [Smaragdicoccus niigatensis]|uniref:aa3-type cytochrome oxidase subunit II n=1 Tax=Smaragdicoccus niigatensis TaxID=359359 RepID=UPI00037B9A78|nr:cytochrome c oxidase subunit II [Smaragdicoccus niigatensis]
MNVQHSRVLRRAGLALALVVAALVLSGCDLNNGVTRFGWPEGVTPQATKMRDFWSWSVVAALAMGVFVWGLTFWTVAFHRKKKDSPEFPRQTGYNMALELTYTFIPFVIISVLFYFTVVVQNYVNDHTKKADVTVDVTAFQWNWKFGYREIDGVNMANTAKEAEMAKAAEALKTRSLTTGECAQEELAKLSGEALKERKDECLRPGPVHGKSGEDLSYLKYDNVETVGSSTEVPVLVLPIDRRIEFHIASADVVHSFWVIDFLFKRDVVPNPAENHSDNIFQIDKIERTGAYVGRCAEMCGAYHSMMNFEVRAVSPENFQKYIDLRKQGKTTGEALAAIGESPIATSTAPFNTDRASKEASGLPGK